MVAHPESVEELVQLVTSASQAGRPVKAVGAGHSFNQIAATDGVQVCLDQLIGLTSVDHDSGLSPSAAAPRLLSSMSCWLPKASWRTWATLTNRPSRERSPRERTAPEPGSAVSQPRSGGS